MISENTHFRKIKSKNGREEEERMKWVSLGLVVLLAFVFSCAPTVMEGRKVDSAKLKEMSVGQTNKAQVEQVFGKPARVETVSPGIDKYTYNYRTTDPEWYTIDTVQKQEFEVWFQNGVLMYYKLRSEGLEPIFKQ
jgi:outer membrane protein assembly factor BamE (lipoprotein component of BamABCDE complex)